MSQLFEDLKVNVAKMNKKIVFPEGTDHRILAAAARLAEEQMLTPVLIGESSKIKEKANELQLQLHNVDIVHPQQFADWESIVDAFVERRKGRTTKEQAREILLDPNYFGTMLVYVGYADGLVSGAAHSTAETVRPALQIIKTKHGMKKTSGVFIMVRNNEKYVFADCAINISPTSQDLAEIAIGCHETAKLFNIDPKIAMLSFSTKGSAKSSETEKVIEAVQIVKEMYPNIIIDGEFQFDAAFVPKVAEKKAPDSILKGDANVFVFPSLEAGNIGYKIAQRLGNFEAVGPILQGLNKPVNDLSRGCNEEDVYKLALITAAQGF